jgi:hypothetical protein
MMKGGGQPVNPGGSGQEEISDLRSGPEQRAILKEIPGGSGQEEISDGRSGPEQKATLEK